MRLMRLPVVCVIFTFHILLVQTSVVLYKREFTMGSNPSDKYIELKCDFDLTCDQYHVNKVVISKNDHVFYFQYFNNNNRGLVESDHPDEGWVATRVRNKISGSYKCLVTYTNDNRSVIKESDIVSIVTDGESVKLNINHKVIHQDEDLKLGCQYNILSNDSFFGLSLTKDDQQFFRYYNDRNHTFEPIDGIHNITWSSYARAIYMNIKNADNLTAGLYGCSINFSNPSTEDVMSLTDRESIEFRSNYNRIDSLPSLAVMLMINLILWL